METFTGYGVMGLTFDSGHVLGLRCWHRSSIGPPYTSVWHRDPGGRWAFWSTAEAGVSCSRYVGELAQRAEVADVAVEWHGERRLVVTMAVPDLRWEVDLAPTVTARLLTAAARRLPAPLLARPAVLRALGPAAGWLLRTGPLALTGRMPNGQGFRLVPCSVVAVRASRARLGGVDLGLPAPLPVQAAIGGFRIPQRGLLAVGEVSFEPLDPARHSTRLSRRPAPSSAPRC